MACYCYYNWKLYHKTSVLKCVKTLSWQYATIAEDRTDKTNNQWNNNYCVLIVVSQLYFGGGCNCFLSLQVTRWLLEVPQWAWPLQIRQTCTQTPCPTLSTLTSQSDSDCVLLAWNIFLYWEVSFSQKYCITIISIRRKKVVKWFWKKRAPCKFSFPKTVLNKVFLLFHFQSAAVRWLSCGLNGQPSHSSAHLCHRHPESVAWTCHSGPAQSPCPQTVRTPSWSDVNHLIMLSFWWFLNAAFWAHVFF